MESFLQKQLMGNDNGSWADSERQFQARLLNIFPQIFTLPLSLWNLIIVLMLIKSNQFTSLEVSVLSVLTLLNVTFTIILWSLSMVVQRTYSIRDSNFLRMHQSQWFNLSQIVQLLPLCIQFIYMYYTNEYELSYSGLNYTVLVLVLIYHVGQLMDCFISLPYILPYKLNTTLISQPFNIALMICVMSQQSQVDTISICIFATPIFSKVLIQMMNIKLSQILYNSLYKEKKKSIKQVVTVKRSYDEEVPFVIEKELNQQKQIQVDFLENQDFRYFIQYLRLVDLMKLDEQQSIERETQGTTNNKRSKFIISIIILLKSHIVQCQCNFCYCKGYRGERRRIIEKNFHTIKMKIFNDFEMQNILIQVELMRRYLRYYAKLVFEIEQNREHPSLIKITQLLHFLSDSDECYQTLLLVLEYKSKHPKQNTFMQSVALTVITSFAKYSILYKMQATTTTDEVETTLSYKDYRLNEILRDKIIQQIFNNIQQKLEFLKFINFNKISYKSLDEQISRLVLVNQETLQKITDFHEKSNCRTSLLLFMLFAFEVLNDYDQFIRVNKQLKTSYQKFFEHSRFNVSNSGAYRVCFLKVNLARHAKLGKISRGEIVQFSNNTPEIFGYTQREFTEQVTTIHTLVTPNLASIHDQLLELFLLTNRPAILRRKRPLLGQKKDNQLIFAEMFVDLCFNITNDQFPVYCFLREITPQGKYQNIKGHIILNDQQIIEGVSTSALDLFKVKNADIFYGQHISTFIPNFQRYYDRLIYHFKLYENLEKQKQKQGSCTYKLDITTQQVFLNVFEFQTDKVNFIINYGSRYDSYSLEIKFMMKVGMIHDKQYISYLIEIYKVNMNDEVESTDKYENSSTDKSSIQIVDNEKCSEKSIGLNRYQFPQADNIRMIQNENEGINQQIIIENIIDLHQQNNNAMMLSPHVQNHETNRTQKQQQFYQAKLITKRSIDQYFEDSNVESNQAQQNNLNAKTTSSQQSNQGMTTIIQKAQQYSKFASKGSNPLLINLILIVDILGLISILLISSFIQVQFTQTQETSVQIVDVLQAFVTTDYTRTTFNAIELQQGDDTSSSLHEILIDKLNNVTNEYLSKYQEYSDNSLVKTTLSGIFVSYFDIQQQQAFVVNAWSELFYVMYSQKNLLQYNTINPRGSLFNQAVLSLVLSYTVHLDAYQKLTQEFLDKQLTESSNLFDNLTILIIVYIIILVLFSITYYAFYCNIFKLYNKILRCSEQVTFQALEAEQLRCSSLLLEYPQYFDLDIYSYHFKLRDHVELQKAQDAIQRSSRRISAATIKKTEQRKQIQIQDEHSLFQSCFFILAASSLIITLVYFPFTYHDGTVGLDDLKWETEQFNELIMYSEQFSQLTLYHSILQYQQQLIKLYQLETNTFDGYIDYLNITLTTVQALGNSLVYKSTGAALSLLTSLVDDVCATITESSCSIIIGGKLKSGVLYSSSYYVGIIRDNLVSKYDQTMIYHFTSEDALAIAYINTAIVQLIQQYKVQLVNQIQQSLDAKYAMFVSFNVIFVIVWICNTYLLNTYIRRIFYNVRQIPFVLPPQCLYGEDSFMKTLNYVEKVYNSLIQ